MKTKFLAIFTFAMMIHGGASFAACEGGSTESETAVFNYMSKYYGDVKEFCGASVQAIEQTREGEIHTVALACEGQDIRLFIVILHALEGNACYAEQVRRAD